MNGANVSPCNTPAVILKESVSPSGVNTLGCVFSWSVDIAGIIDCGIPNHIEFEHS